MQFTGSNNIRFGSLLEIKVGQKLREYGSPVSVKVKGNETFGIEEDFPIPCFKKRATHHHHFSISKKSMNKIIKNPTKVNSHKSNVVKRSRIKHNPKLSYQIITSAFMSLINGPLFCFRYVLRTP